MPEQMVGKNSRSESLTSIAVVTPSWNRARLLESLYQSLLNQTDQDFTWVVVDDSSDDGTWDLLSSLSESGFGIETFRNSENRGKCASLNRAFEMVPADFYLVVDSDDRLNPGAIDLVRKAVEEVDEQKSVGAIFFSYATKDGLVLGGPFGFESGLIATRSEFDERYDKYDGSVGYFRRVVERFQYPEYPNETYVGPTVLQLEMAPKYSVLFTHSIVGVAEYQPDGLTASGRWLRMQNPLGMMHYCRLQAQQAGTWATRLKHSLMYFAYQSMVHPSERDTAGTLRKRPALNPLLRLAGAVLARYWFWRFSPRPASRRDELDGPEASGSDLSK